MTQSSESGPPTLLKRRPTWATEPAYWALAAIAVGAAAARIVGLGRESLWQDEILSVLRMRLPWPDILTETGGHQPLYFILLRLWQDFFGDTEFSLRFPSAIFGVFTVVAVYFLARQFTNKWAALVAPLLGAASPIMVWYSQEVRMYTLSALLLVLATLFIVKYMEAFDRKYLVAYGVSAAVGVFSHFYFVYFVAALNLVVLAALLRPIRFGQLVRWSGVQVLVALPAVYRLGEVLFQVENQLNTADGGYSEPSGKVLAKFIRVMGFEPLDLGGSPLIMALLLIAVGFSVAVAIRRGDKIQILLPLLIVPVLLLLAGQQLINLPVVVRYFVPTIPLWYIFPAYGVGRLTWPNLSRHLLEAGTVTALLGVLVAWSGFTWYQQYSTPTKAS